jgi:hypothetical protein
MIEVALPRYEDDFALWLETQADAGLAAGRFPEACPWPIEEILGEA